MSCSETDSHLPHLTLSKISPMWADSNMSHDPTCLLPQDEHGTNREHPQLETEVRTPVPCSGCSCEGAKGLVTGAFFSDLVAVDPSAKSFRPKIRYPVAVKKSGLAKKPRGLVLAAAPLQPESNDQVRNGTQEASERLKL